MARTKKRALKSKKSKSVQNDEEPSGTETDQQMVEQMAGDHLEPEALEAQPVIAERALVLQKRKERAAERKAEGEAKWKRIRAERGKEREGEERCGF
jgi:hypothetical protein